MDREKLKLYSSIALSVGLTIYVIMNTMFLQTYIATIILTIISMSTYTPINKIIGVYGIMQTTCEAIDSQKTTFLVIGLIPYVNIWFLLAGYTDDFFINHTIEW